VSALFILIVSSGCNKTALNRQVRSNAQAAASRPEGRGWDKKKSSDIASNQEATRLSRLISSAASADRDEWFPAARELGRMAASGQSLRDRVWREASINTLGMKFVRIQPGEFVMGPPVQDPLWVSRSHVVRLTQPFYVCVTETTNEQYAELYPDHQPDARFSPDGESPVVGLSWEKVQEFCQELSRREGVKYRLPTEAEWEYVCRAGMPSPHKYCFGDDEALLPEYAWYARRRMSAAPVALLKPNAWGVYDMHGNVLEIVGDWFNTDYGAGNEALLIDPSGPSSGFNHTLRGGEWYIEDLRGCECAFRLSWPLFWFHFKPSAPPLSRTIGFRLVREVRTE
jgi:formylglycine-generating enzyme required for sulfatase activity